MHDFRRIGRALEGPSKFVHNSTFISTFLTFSRPSQLSPPLTIRDERVHIESVKNILAQNWAMWAQYGPNQGVFRSFLEFGISVLSYCAYLEGRQAWYLLGNGEVVAERYVLVRKLVTQGRFYLLPNGPTSSLLVSFFIDILKYHVHFLYVRNL